MSDDIKEQDFLNVAVRAWTGNRKKSAEKPHSIIPAKMLVFDTETTTEASQTLKFGSAQLVQVVKNMTGIEAGKTLDEIVFHDDNLAVDDPHGYDVLVSYCETRNLKLISKTEFVKRWIYAYCVPRKNETGVVHGTCALVGFNLPFDMSRLAYAHSAARERNDGAFSFRVFPDWNGSDSKFYPRFICNSLDSKKALMSWGSTKGAGQLYRREQFIDVRQLIWSLTNRAVSLATGCKLFGLPEEYSKSHAEEHGTITPDYIDYNRQDVTATAHLAIAALKDFASHPIETKPSKLFSPASVAKGYLRAMGVTPMLDRDGIPSDNTLLGNITSTFYGARAEVHIRKVPVPVTVNDFTSMYCLVNTLLKHWNHITAQSVKDVDVTEQFRTYLNTVTVDTILDGSQWPSFTGFALIEPDGDILPVRAEYSDDSAYNVGINRLHSTRPFWYAMPDVIASVLLTGKVPVIQKAVRFIPSTEKIQSLKPVKLMRNVLVNPATEDFFKVVTERRSAIKTTRTCSGNEGCTCQECKSIEFLKVIGNSGSYGIYVEMLRTVLDSPESAETYGMYDHPWTTPVKATETAQEFCYPPVGSVITAGARLLLAVLERLVTDVGGTWLFCDTDSMAVVSDTEGSIIECPGGQHRTVDNQDAIKALTRGQMTVIRDAVNRLNPFDVKAVPSILKDETSKTNASGQVFGFAISAKRYTLFTYVDGKPVIPEKIDGKEAFKQHGLGLYLNPADVTGKPVNRKWIQETWQYILDKEHGLKPAMPAWHDHPAMGRVSLSSPHVINVLKTYNLDRDYGQQVKPFGFVLMIIERSSSIGSKKERRFISPYSSDPADWINQEWYDLHDPQAAPVKITTGPVTAGTVRVKDMRTVIRTYEVHPEVKSWPPQEHGWDGFDPAPYGVLSRRTVRIQGITHIGKEADDLESVNAHMKTIREDLFTIYKLADRTIIQRAFDGYSNRQIARMVNSESEDLQKTFKPHMKYKTYRNAHMNSVTFEETPYTDTEQLAALTRHYGTPVTIDHKVIQRFFSGKNVTKDHAAAIERTAAKMVGRIRGIQDNIGPGQDMTTSRLALAYWAETGATTETDLANARLQKTSNRLHIS